MVFQNHKLHVFCYIQEICRNDSFRKYKISSVFKLEINMQFLSIFGIM